MEENPTEENQHDESTGNEKALPEHWNVIYTAPRAEKRVYERLLELGVHCYLPLYTTLRQWSDRKKKVELPLFRSYIFVKPARGERLPILEVFGVVRFIYYLGKPAVVRQKEIDAIRRFLMQTEGYNIRVQQGDNVEIAGGPMEGIYGEVIRIGKHKLILQIQQLGMSIIAEVDKGMVRRPLKKRD